MSGIRRLYRGGQVLLAGAAALEAADVVTEGERIERILPAGAADPAAVDEVQDLDGAALLPGFVDGHCHLELAAITQDHHVQVHVPPLETLGQVLGRLADARRRQPTGWLVARTSFGLQRKVEERRLPHRSELDAISSGEPLVLLSGLHVACLNSEGVRRLGLGDEDALPGWIDIDRDDAGPTGVYTEVWDRLPTYSADSVIASLRAHAQTLFARAGTTSLSTISTSAEDVRALHRMTRMGELPFRVRFYVHVPRTASLDTVVAWGPESGFGDHRMRFGGIKIFVDGEGATALGVPRNDEKWTPGQLRDLVSEADRAGIQVMMHAVTPHAIRMIVSVVEELRARAPMRVAHRIEHGADFIDTADIGRVRAAGLRLVATPHFAVSAEAHREHFQPLRQLIDAGFRVIGASDATGTVPEGAAPLYNIAAAVGRMDGRGGASRERVTALEGLNMFTSWSAEGADELADKGSIARGKLADFVVLDRDPLAPETEPADVRVRASVVGGAVASGSLD